MAPVHREGAPRAGEAARGAQLGVALGHEQVGARPVASEELGQPLEEGPVGREHLARLVQGLGQLVHRVVELVDAEGAQRVEVLHGLVERGLDLGHERAVALQDVGVHRAVRHERGGRARRHGVGQGGQDLVDEAAGDVEQGLGARDVAAVDRHEGGEAPQRPLELGAHGGDGRAHVVGAGPHGRAVAGLHGRLELADRGREPLRLGHEGLSGAHQARPARGERDGERHQHAEHGNQHRMPTTGPAGRRLADTLPYGYARRIGRAGAMCKMLTHPKLLRTPLKNKPYGVKQHASTSRHATKTPAPTLPPSSQALVSNLCSHHKSRGEDETPWPPDTQRLVGRHIF